MEGTTLNVAAPVFQPGGSFSSNVPAARQPSPLQMPPSVSGPGTPLQDRNGQQMLSQIQNQMVPGGGVPGGTVSMSANSRPFVPGVASTNIFKPQTPTTPYQSGPPPVSNISRSPLPGHRLAHGLNAGSVHLTGLPAFLATPPIMTNMPPQTPGFAGPPSPLSPHGSVSPSPFMMPQGQTSLGVPHPAGMMNGMKLRKGKGPQPVTPLKTTGHNSTPSISMNPAAFAASLAGLKAKKKVIVSMPNEQPLPEDELILAQEEGQPVDDEQQSRDDPEDQAALSDRREAAKRRHARAAAATRQTWVQRQPWSSEQHDQVPCLEVPEDAFVTCEIHPEPWPHSLGLPDTIEIYLPGMTAWEEYREMRYEEQQMEAEAAERDALMSLVRPKPLLPSQFATLNADQKGLSLSISSPADPSMVSFKLNRFLQSQQQAQEDPNKPINDNSKTEEEDDAGKQQPFSRFQTDLPNRLREAFARRRGESTSELSLRPSLKHSHTMSLGLPSSGGPFGPEVYSALDMIRANSDEGPSKPPSESHDLPEKPLSDSEAMFGKTEPFLAQIVEDEAEEDAEDDEVKADIDAAKNAGSGNWKDLGRGFGYEDPDTTAAPAHGSFRKHARQASRISVSTSHRGGEEHDDELLPDSEDVEIRTNPSEDADASDFEEELDEYGPEHWHARRTSAHLSAFGDADHRYNYDDLSDNSDEDSLRDSLTPSDEQFSNPSDEEAAREERIMRRQHRAAERAARQERKMRQRGRANTNNTLPSSSIGEGDLHEHGRYDFAEGAAYLQYNQHARRSMQAEIISNPSDELPSDLDETETFGHTSQSRRANDEGRLSQDFRFPPPKPPMQQSSHNSNGTSSNAASMSGTLGRASGFSMLNPGAKEFKFGGSAAGIVANRAVSAPVSSNQGSHGDGQAGHFRLPSIKTSSFGSSALGEVPANAPHLNVGAPPFTPGSFTFKSAVRLQVPEIERGSSPKPIDASTGIPGAVGDDDVENREKQGREKRTRYGPIDYNSEDEQHAAYSTSPPRPKASTASIEGPLRDFSSLSRHGPPPFLPPGFQQQQRAVSHESRFTADAPSFVPTWARNASQFGGSTSFKRPTLPDWSQPAQGDVQQNTAASIRDPSFFTRETGSKAIPIRRPSENDQSDSKSASRSPQESRSPAQGVAPQSGLSVESASAAPAVSACENDTQSAHLDVGQASTETLRAPGSWSRASRAESAWPAERSRPVHIPVGPHSYQSSSASMASDTGAGPSVRWGDRRAPSSIGMSSFDRRLRRADRGPYGRVVRDDDDDDDEDESLTDFVEEIAERVDKALEGWAGKILDEVTIMGQVRPLPRGAIAAGDLSIDQDKMVQEISRRMEEALDNQLATTFSAHVRKSTDASDETQATVRPGRRRDTLADEKMAASGLVDAPGEWDFDYVQDVLEIKLGEFRQQIEATMAQVMQKIESSSNSASAAGQVRDINGVNGSSSSSDMAEAVTSRLVNRLSAMLESHTNSTKKVQSESGSKLQQAMQDKLDENLVLLSEKSAADRSNIQQMLESELHGLESSIGQVGMSIKEHLQSALKECLPPLLEDKAANDATLADRLTNQLGQALGPVLSEERRCLLEDSQNSRDLLLEALPSSSQIAQSTVKLIEPIVQSLKSDPIDSDALVTRLAEVIGKQSIEHMVDLNPVLALLEPLISKQEDARSMSKKILQQQEDTERTLSELPGAINAKTEIFLSSASDTSEKQGLILEKIAEIKSGLDRKTAAMDASSVSLDSSELNKKLEDLAQGKELMQETAGRTLSELAGVYQVLNSSYEALERLEKQYTSTEEVHRDLTTKLEKQAQTSSEMARELREAEARAIRAEAEKAELATKVTSSDRESAMLRDQLAQMAAELAAAKAERAKEVDASSKAVSEAVARADRAEAASAETQERMGRLLEQANVAEREAYDSAKSVLERASKAEGQVQALEKRIAEQDTKIANLQQVSATQKQKAAQSHQKLAEGEKRVKELEAKTDQLSEATARLSVLEVKAAELEETKQKLVESEERETHMREEIRRYDERFTEMEHDLLAMKDGFVEKTVHEETQKRLGESEKLVEELQAKIAALQRSEEEVDGWEAVESPRPPTGAWASMHAPRLPKGGLRVGSGSGSADTSGELLMGSRSVSFASTGSRKEVEVDEGGWWS